MLVERTAYSAGGRTVERSRDVFRGDRTTVVWEARDRVTQAIIFDFNGTLSDDEPILCEIFIQLFAEHGKPLSAQEYFDELAGLSDPEIVRTWLGATTPTSTP